MSTYYKGLEKRIANMTYHEVIPSTISMKTYQLDKAKEMIYGSFDLEGLGMTNGGDVVEDNLVGNCNVVFKESMWQLEQGIYHYHNYQYYNENEHSSIEIIGKQYDEEK
jgi:hypothetical protein